MEKVECFSIDDEDVLWFKDRLVVPKVLELRQSILDEAHATRLSIHPRSNKMYQAHATRSIGALSTAYTLAESSS